MKKYGHITSFAFPFVCIYLLIIMVLLSIDKASIVTDIPLTDKQLSSYDKTKSAIQQLEASMITDDVGNRIRYLRNKMGLSQEKLALKAGIDRTYLAGIESGKRNATIISLEKIIIALEIDIKVFFDFSKEVDYK